MMEQETKAATPERRSNSSSGRSRFRRLTAQREFIMILVIIVFAVIMALSSPIFISWLNLEAILMALTVEATIAIGMVILLISGGLDLSVGSTLALAGVVAGLVLTAGMGRYPCNPCGLAGCSRGWPRQRPLDCQAEDQPVYYNFGNHDHRARASCLFWPKAAPS